MPQAPATRIDKPVALRAARLLRGFTDVGVKILAEVASQRSLGKGSYAFKAGEASATLTFVVKGTLQLQADGGAALGEVVSGDSVGGLALLVEGEHVVSAQAASDVELLEVTRAAFDEMKRTHPRTALKLTLALAQDLADRLREAKGPLREFLTWEAGKRQG